MKQFDNNDDVRLHALLQIKRLERPNEKQWQRFEQSFEQRRLSAIIGTRENWNGKLFKIIGLLLNKKLTYGLGALCLVIFGGLFLSHISNTDDKQYYDQIVNVTNNSQKLYVCDNLEFVRSSIDHETYLSFNKKGIGYVCDALSHEHF